MEAIVIVQYFNYPKIKSLIPRIITSIYYHRTTSVRPSPHIIPSFPSSLTPSTHHTITSCSSNQLYDLVYGSQLVASLKAVKSTCDGCIFGTGSFKIISIVINTSIGVPWTEESGAEPFLKRVLLRETSSLCASQYCT